MSERDFLIPEKFITPLDEEIGRCPAPAWEEDWVETEEEHLGRPTEVEKSLRKHCTDCTSKEVKIECFAIPLVDKVRLVTFPEYGIRTFSLDSIAECGLRK